ncbi:hypothetical protein M378DRAFT_164666 [Amanita muscaria Koide BX008]|uniref:Uncharacterized protein n=1 Tax=Amanita muscaria (strain Koide BX008) TaxID=946122 RepID=A0A0C2SJG4_AMAMK|nr:hypothetical protein M378DRAFT_164666 [Amanita muscaria Koide BX008]
MYGVAHELVSVDDGVLAFVVVVVVAVVVVVVVAVAVFAVVELLVGFIPLPSTLRQRLPALDAVLRLSTKYFVEHFR